MLLMNILNILLFIFIWNIYTELIKQFKISKEKETMYSVIGILIIIVYMKEYV